MAIAGRSTKAELAASTVVVAVNGADDGSGWATGCADWDVTTGEELVEGVEAATTAAPAAPATDVPTEDVITAPAGALDGTGGRLKDEVEMFW